MLLFTFKRWRQCVAGLPDGIGIYTSKRKAMHIEFLYSATLIAILKNRSIVWDSCWEENLIWKICRLKLKK